MRSRHRLGNIIVYASVQLNTLIRNFINPQHVNVLENRDKIRKWYYSNCKHKQN